MKEVIKKCKKYKKHLIFIAVVIVILFLCLFDFKNNIKDKIEIVTLDNGDILFQDINITISEDNELIVDFILKNNTDDHLNYKMYFDAQHRGAFDYVNMKVIKDGSVEYDECLDEITSDNIFMIGNIEAFDEEKYKIILKGKRIKFKLFGAIRTDSVYINDTPSKVTVTMAENSENEKNFTWHMNNFDTGVVQIVEAKNKNKSIADFDKKGVLEFQSNVKEGNFSDYVHKAKATNLKAGTEYYYRVGNKENNIWSEVGKFVTDDGNDKFSFIYLTDMQNDFSEYSTAIHTAVSALNVNPSAEFILNTGDFVNQASNADEWYGILNNDVFKNVTNVAATGNHDYDVVDSARNIFNQHFNYDANENVNTENGIYYSFNYGNVHFTVLNTNEYSWSEISTEQLAWLEEDLKKHQDYDFRIVAMHRGAYTPGPHIYDYGDILPLTYQLTPIFDKYNVDLVLQGHDHAYGLTYPINGSFKTVKVKTKNIKSKEISKKIPVMVKPNAPVYYINGAAGDKHYNTLIKNSGFYMSYDYTIDSVAITTAYDQIDFVYSKFQKVDTPTEDDMKLALFSSIEVDGDKLLVNTYTVNNLKYREPKLYHSFGISK